MSAAVSRLCRNVSCLDSGIEDASMKRRVNHRIRVCRCFVRIAVNRGSTEVSTLRYPRQIFMHAAKVCASITKTEVGQGATTTAAAKNLCRKLMSRDMRRLFLFLFSFRQFSAFYISTGFLSALAMCVYRCLVMLECTDTTDTCDKTIMHRNTPSR